jgi:hypothetical protein
MAATGVCGSIPRFSGSGSIQPLAAPALPIVALGLSAFSSRAAQSAGIPCTAHGWPTPRGTYCALACGMLRELMEQVTRRTLVIRDTA